mgnify:CR=1 FL=1
MSKPQFITFTASIDAYVPRYLVQEFDRAMRKGDHVEALDSIREWHILHVRSVVVTDAGSATVRVPQSTLEHYIAILWPAGLFKAVITLYLKLLHLSVSDIQQTVLPRLVPAV